MRRMKALEALDGARIVEVVEVLISLAHQRVAVQRIGMHLGGPAKAGRRQQHESHPQARIQLETRLQTQFLPSQDTPRSL